jgi:hypothetical protein
MNRRTTIALVVGVCTVTLLGVVQCTSGPCPRNTGFDCSGERDGTCGCPPSSLVTWVGDARPRDVGVADVNVQDGSVRDADATRPLSDAGAVSLADAGIGGTWHAMPLVGNPNILVADDPTVVEPLQFVPCASGRIGCTTLKKSWTSFVGAGLRLRTPSENVVYRTSNGKTWLVYERTYPRSNFDEAPDTWMTVLQELHGPTALAVYQQALVRGQAVTISGRCLGENHLAFGVFDDLSTSQFLGTFSHETRELKLWRTPTESLPKTAGVVSTSDDQIRPTALSARIRTFLLG